MKIYTVEVPAIVTMTVRAWDDGRVEAVDGSFTIGAADALRMRVEDAATGKDWISLPSEQATDELWNALGLVATTSGGLEL